MTLDPASNARVITELADAVNAEADRGDKVWTDEVLHRVLPAFCADDLIPTTLLALFRELCDNRAVVTSAAASDEQMNVADVNAAELLRLMTLGVLGAVA